MKGLTLGDEHFIRHIVTDHTATQDSVVLQKLLNEI